MLCVPAYTHERRPYSVALYPTSFNLDSILALTICAQRKTRRLSFTSGPMACRKFFVRLYILGRKVRSTYWATGGSTSEDSNHDGSNERKLHRLGEF